MIRREGERMLVAGAVTLQNVAVLLEEGLREVRAGASVIDLLEISDLDSSLLAVLFAWMREGKTVGRPVSVANLPKGLQTLAQLYGVEDFLTSTAAPAQ